MTTEANVLPETGALRNLSVEEAKGRFLLFDLPEKILEVAAYPSCSVRISRGVVFDLATTRKERKHGVTPDDHILTMLFSMRQAIAELEYQRSWWTFEMIVKGKKQSFLAYKDSSKGPAIHVIKPNEY